jgi:hypothetical protein
VAAGVGKYNSQSSVHRNAHVEGIVLHGSAGAKKPSRWCARAKIDVGPGSAHRERFALFGEYLAWQSIKRFEARSRLGECWLKCGGWRLGGEL